jgi:hypothetical protein
MDEQVEAVLIAPLDRNRQPQAQAHERPPDEQPAPVASTQPTPEEAASSPTRGAGKEELPVWLL